ncbi:MULTISPECIES: DUF2238 domain-containing protein [unclassified Paludibacterium]|uniref:DUF2238 domain-containing protein n=1 Tax=unclassified Paludibacterium TaxID=2618429 RepID=UPI001C040AA5|nr:DUF2238 domain-containing protein [Paludibacterium sp. B53371]BEV70825.1 DUF2238 domain-containing protein [Paludibacterium sp. THUN1379]
MHPDTRFRAGLLLLIALLAISGYHPYDQTTWLLEVLPVLIVIPLLSLTYRRFTFTPLVYGLIFVHCCVLLLGGKYTYARVPIGFDLAHLLGIQRNPYDKIGHLFQGFVPALVIREILLRGRHVAGRKMLSFVTVCIALAISASYELLEWASALAMGQGADAFLGTQGDPWDTQSDMFCALIGASLALLLLARVQDRQMRALRLA